MFKYNYKARDEAGKVVKGKVEAKDEGSAVTLLHQRKLFVISIKNPPKSILGNFQILNRVKFNDKLNFTRQLSTMINSGLVVTVTPSLLEEQFESAMSKMVGELLLDIRAGRTLAQAMAKHPQVFDKVYVALVRAGESAGILDRVLKRLARNLEKQKRLMGKIKGAMVYPVIIIVGMVGVGMVMSIFVIPRMTGIYEEFQAELPMPTKILLAISSVMRKLWWLILILMVGGFYLLGFLYKMPGFKKKVDALYFKLPIFGKLRQKIMLAEFSRVLGLLVGAGILVIEALEIARDSFGSPIYREALSEAVKHVKKGYPLTNSLARTDIFPPLFIQMMSVGEETGKVDEVLRRISYHYDNEASVLVKGLTTALEPIIMIILALGVGFMVIAIILPIYNLTSQF